MLVELFQYLLLTLDFFAESKTVLMFCSAAVPGDTNLSELHKKYGTWLIFPTNTTGTTKLQQCMKKNQKQKIHWDFWK